MAAIRRRSARYRFASWEELDEIVPLRPRPVRLGSWQSASHRLIVGAALLLTLLAALVLLRPLRWGGLAGEQSMPAVAVLPRTLIAFVPLAMAAAAGLTMQLLIGIRRWAGALGIVGLALLGLEANARVRIEAATLIRLHATTVNARAFVGLLALCGLAGGICAVAGAIAGIRANLSRKRSHIGSWLISASFLLPLVAYLISLATPSALAGQLYAVSRDLGTRATPPEVMAYAIFQPYIGLIYMAVVLAAWQAITFAQAISEASPLAARLVTRSYARTHKERAVTDRGARERIDVRAWLIATTVVAVGGVKLAYDIAGYAGFLPNALGGNADLWKYGNTKFVWYFTVLVAAPLAWSLLRRIHPEDKGKPLGPPLIVLSLLFAILGPIQIISQTLADVAPGLVPLHPAAGQPLFVSLTLLNWVTLIGIGAGTPYYWHRNRPAATLFGIAFVIYAPGLVNAGTGLSLPIAGLGRLDLVMSAVALAWSVGYLVRLAARPPTWLVALWLGLSVLVHLTTLIPGAWQSRFFTFGALLPLAYGLLWAGGQLNELARTRPIEAALSICLMALLLIMLTAEIWIGDRFGRQFNVVVTDGGIFQASARQAIGIPLLAILCIRATQRAPRVRTSTSTSTPTHPTVCVRTTGITSTSTHPSPETRTRDV